jgi:predicted HicB family RNase H-like nuclease
MMTTSRKDSKALENNDEKGGNVRLSISATSKPMKATENAEKEERILSHIDVAVEPFRAEYLTATDDESQGLKVDLADENKLLFGRESFQKDLSDTKLNMEESRKSKKGKYKGQLILRTTSETHQQIATECSLRGVSVNSFLEQAVQRELSSANRPPVFANRTHNPASDRLINDKEASAELYKAIEPFLNKEKIDIFSLADALKRFLIGLEGAIDEIQSYLIQEPEILRHCVCEITELVERYRH